MSSSSEARTARRAATRRRGAEVVGGGHGSNKNKYPDGQDPEKSARKQDKRKMVRRGSDFDSDDDDGGAEELPDTSRVASHEEPAEEVKDDSALSPQRMKTVADALDLAVGADTSSAVAKAAPVHPFGAPSVTGILSGACLVSVGTNQRGTTVRLPPGGSVTLGIDFGIMTDDVPAYQCTIGHDGSTWSVTGRDALKPAHVFFSHSLSRTLEPGACVTLAHGNVLVLDSAGAYAFRLETVNNGDSLDAIMQGVDSTNEAVTRAPPRALNASLAAAATDPEGTASREAPEGWLADQAAVETAVAAAKAEATVASDASEQILAAAEAGLPALAARAKAGTLDWAQVESYLTTAPVGRPKGKVKDAPKNIGKLLAKLRERATRQRTLDVAKAELNARLRLEEEARASLEAASAGASREARLRSMKACGELMAAADVNNLNGEPHGNLGKLLTEMRRAKVGLISAVDGSFLKNDKGALLDRMVRSLDAVLTKRPPEEVVQTSLRSIAAEKLAPQGNKEASEALEADVNSACGAFPQETKLELGPMPSLDGAPHQRLQTACRRRMDAPPSQVASVRFQMPFDSDSLGGATALPSRLPEWDRRPRVMVDASTVATIDSMQEHADSLLQAQRIAEGRARAARNRQSGAREESSSSAEESSAEEDESKEDGSESL
jgi:hypothetical protein